MKKVINYKVQKEEWETLKDEAFKKLNAKYKDGKMILEVPAGKSFFIKVE